MGLSPIHLRSRRSTWTPLRLPGLALWLDPTHGVLTTADAPAEDSDAVLKWLPRYPALGLADPDGNPPTFDTAGLTNVGGLLFDGTDDKLDLDQLYTRETGFCLAWVSRLLNVSPANETISGSHGAGAWCRQLSATQVRITDGAATRTFTHTDQTHQSVHIINGDAAGLAHYFNGVASTPSGSSFDAFGLDELAADNGATFGEIALGDVILAAKQTPAVIARLQTFLAGR